MKPLSPLKPSNRHLRSQFLAEDGWEKLQSHGHASVNIYQHNKYKIKCQLMDWAPPGKLVARSRIPIAPHVSWKMTLLKYAKLIYGNWSIRCIAIDVTWVTPRDLLSLMNQLHKLVMKFFMIGLIHDAIVDTLWMGSINDGNWWMLFVLHFIAANQSLTFCVYEVLFLIS